MPIRNNTLIRSGDFAGYTRTRYICKNAPGVGSIKTRDGHTYESFAWGNPAGARWMAAMRSQVCKKCGGQVIPIQCWTKPIG